MNHWFVDVFSIVAIPYAVNVLVLLVVLPARYKLASTCLLIVILPVPALTIVMAVPVANATLALLGIVSVVGEVLDE